MDLEELTLDALQTQLSIGALSSRDLTAAYLDRIATIDRAGQMLRSILETNPDALEIATSLDRERAAGHVRGPLHGVPILLKDNIDTADRLHTTAGSLALLDAGVAADAPVARKLREAGAVLLGKANMSEWANFRSTRSSSGWSGRGRQTRNPYVLDRSPGGSSSGSGVAVSANLCMAALGTETDGSIMSPSSASGIVGIKPTVGLTSRQGVVPISHSQDTVGPHARTVADAACVLSAIAEPQRDYRADLDPNGLRGARIGVVRQFHTGYSEHTDRIFENALDVLRACGAELADDVVLPGESAIRDKFEDQDVSAERLVLEFELQTDLARYLATRAHARLRSVRDLIHFNEEHAAEEMPYFRQELFDRAASRGSLSDPLYMRAREENAAFTRRLATLFDQRHLVALVSPTNAPAWAIDVVDGDRHLGGSAQPAAVAGWPLVTVPAGYALDELPLGLTFMGPAWSEATLIKLAHAFEQAHPVRRRPRYRPTLLDLP